MIWHSRFTPYTEAIILPITLIINYFAYFSFQHSITMHVLN